MIGSSIVSGSLPRARATLSRTSAAAESGSRFEREAHVDAARLRPALRRHHLDALDAGQRVLERLRHLRLDDFGRRAAIGDRHADHRLVDARVFAHRQPRVRDEADQQDDERQHRANTGRLMHISGSCMACPRSERSGAGYDLRSARGAAVRPWPAGRRRRARLRRAAALRGGLGRRAASVTGAAVAQLQLAGGDDRLVRRRRPSRPRRFASRRWPSSTFVRAALPSMTRNTNCSSPCGTSACSGSTSASRSSLRDEPHAREHAGTQRRVRRCAPARGSRSRARRRRPAG